MNKTDITNKLQQLGFEKFYDSDSKKTTYNKNLVDVIFQSGNNKTFTIIYKNAYTLMPTKRIRTLNFKDVDRIYIDNKEYPQSLLINVNAKPTKDNNFAVSSLYAFKMFNN